MPNLHMRKRGARRWLIVIRNSTPRSAKVTVSSVRAGLEGRASMIVSPGLPSPGTQTALHAAHDRAGRGHCDGRWQL
jgi:hypothetical protein